MKNHRFLWLRNRTTNNRKCEKARNIKEKRTIEMFSTVSKALVVHRSSARDKISKFFKVRKICFRNLFFTAATVLKEIKNAYFQGFGVFLRGLFLYS